MKKRLAALCVMALLAWSATADAQVEQNTSLLLTNVAYTYAQWANGGETLNGAGFALVWEQVTWDRQMSIGFGGGYNSSWFNRADDNFSYKRLPFYAMFKGLFGPPKYTGYLGVGLGATIDRVEINRRDGTPERHDEAAFSILVPLGIYMAPNPKVGFNLNVSYMYSNTDYLKNKSFFIFGFGIVFLM
jgi:hypothetical protein